VEPQQVVLQAEFAEYTGRMVVVDRRTTMKRVAVYLRVSTSKQDTENQLRELTAVGG
jgi:predicted site-specific integrase-resolvase